MHTYECNFAVYDAKGRMTKTKQEVTAMTSIDAKKLIEAQYAGSRISWYHVKVVKK